MSEAQTKSSAWRLRASRKIAVRWGRFVGRVLNRPMAYLARYLPKYSLKLLVSVLLMAGAGSLASIISVLVGKLTDEGFVNHNPDIIWWAPASLVGITLASGIAVYLGSYLMKDVSQSIVTEVRMKMFRRMVHWTPEMFRQNSSAQVNTIFINIVANALSSAADIVTVLVRDSLNVVCLVCVLLWYDWKLTLMAFVIGPMMVFIIRKIRKAVKKTMSSVQNMLEGMAVVLQEDLANFKVVKIFNAYRKEESRFCNFNDMFKSFCLKMQLISAASAPLSQMAMMCGVSVVVVAALWQASHGYLTIGEFVTFLSALMLMSMPLRHIAGVTSSYAMLEFAAEMVDDFLHKPIERLDRGLELDHPLSGAIEFDKVSFRYGNDYALRDVSFSIKSGQMVALVGASGAGKSTLINLIPRFNELQEGSIRFDGIDQKDFSLQYLRSNLALVNQEVMLFDESIENNVRYGKCFASVEEVRAAVQAASLADFVETLPEGLETGIGTQGNHLSGGQKQRVSIARAFIKKAPILLLDEATSALDTASEKFIQQSLSELMKSCTSIVVAHRLSTILSADLIVVFDHGQVVEKGTHEELLALGGVYSKLYNIQFSKQAN